MSSKITLHLLNSKPGARLIWGMQAVFLWSCIVVYRVQTLLNNIKTFLSIWASTGNRPVSIYERPHMQQNQQNDVRRAKTQISLGIHQIWSDKNQKWDPLRAMKTFIRRKVGHTT